MVYPSHSTAGKGVALASGLMACLLVSGCVVGPDFQKPPAPDIHGYTAGALLDTSSAGAMSGGAAQQFAQGRDIPADWWSLFHSKALNALIERALKNNPDLKAGQAALQIARENVLAQQGVYYSPSVSGSLSRLRQQTVGSALAHTQFRAP